MHARQSRADCLVGQSPIRVERLGSGRRFLRKPRGKLQHACNLARLVEEKVGAEGEAARAVLWKRVVGENGDLARMPAAKAFQYAEAIAFLQLQVEDREVPAVRRQKGE